MSINVSQAFKRTSANAIDETFTLSKAEMLTVNDNLMPSKYLTVCQDDGYIYLYDKSATASAETGKFTKFEGGDTIQYTSMPTASEDLEGAVYQYLGATTSTYTHGHWYECVSDGEDPATYSWEETPNYEEMDDSDMDDVVTPLPSVSARYHKYSTEEQVVGEWIDQKPIYEKTIETTFPTGIVDGTTTSNEITFSSVGLPSIDTLVGFEGVRDNRALLNETWGDGTIFRTHVEIAVNDETISISSNRASLSGKPLVIIVRYTKTTD